MDEQCLGHGVLNCPVYFKKIWPFTTANNSHVILEMYLQNIYLNKILIFHYFSKILCNDIASEYWKILQGLLELKSQMWFIFSFLLQHAKDFSCIIYGI